MGRAQTAYDARRWPGSTSKETSDAKRFTFLGAEFSPRQWVGAPAARRLALSRLSLRVASKGRISASLGAVLGGSWISVFMRRRSLHPRSLPPVRHDGPHHFLHAPLAHGERASAGGCAGAPRHHGPPRPGGLEDLGSRRIADQRSLRQHAGHLSGMGYHKPHREFAMVYDVIEVAGGSGGISREMAKLGLKVGPVIDLTWSQWYDLRALSAPRVAGLDDVHAEAHGCPGRAALHELQPRVARASAPVLAPRS